MDYSKSCLDRQISPSASRTEVDELRAEDQEIGRIAQVLDNNDATAASDTASDFIEQLQSVLRLADLVERENQERSVD